MNIIFETQHPSRLYPRHTKGEQLLKSVCPVCKSHDIDIAVVVERGLLKRLSTCLNCNTTWSMRNAHVPLRYEQNFNNRSKYN
jgi:hypothetical protein